MSSKREDMIRLGEILDAIMTPFDEAGLERIPTETKLYMAFNPEKYPIYRRRIMKPVKVRGLWWLHETQWLNWLWHGHNAKVIKGVDGEPDKVLATRSLLPNCFMYIREGGDMVEIEAQTKTTKFSNDKKKKKSAVEWVTASITYEEYCQIQGSLGPRLDTCKHPDEEYDFNP